MASASEMRAQQLRVEIEASLAKRIPSALTPAPRLIRKVLPTRVAAVDQLLQGGVPAGALTELTGESCSGRTSLAMATAAQATQAGQVCAWVDVSDALDPESAAATGIHLERMLWVRCRRRNAAEADLAANARIGAAEFSTPHTERVQHGGGSPHSRS